MNENNASQADERAEEDEYVITRLSTLLAEIAVILKGPALPLRSHGYADLPALVAELKTRAAALASTPSPLQDHEIARAINELRDVAVQFHDTQQLRERIAGIVLPLLKRGPQVAQPAVRVRLLTLAEVGEAEDSDLNKTAANIQHKFCEVNGITPLSSEKGDGRG